MLPSIRCYVWENLCYVGIAADGMTAAVEEYTPEGWPFVEKWISPQGKLPTKWGQMKQ